MLGIVIGRFTERELALDLFHGGVVVGLDLLVVHPDVVHGRVQTHVPQQLLDRGDLETGAQQLRRIGWKGGAV